MIHAGFRNVHFTLLIFTECALSQRHQAEPWDYSGEPDRMAAVEKPMI